MVYKYDVDLKQYIKFNTSNYKMDEVMFPSYCDLSNGTIFISGGINKQTQNDQNQIIDPIGTSYVIEGYQGKVTYADSMITPRYKHELIF